VEACVKFETLVSRLQQFEFLCTIGPESGRELYDFILFGHGTSSCYVAAALDELGRGHLTSVDLERAREWQRPSIDDLLAATDLGKYVSVMRESTSYTWFLKKAIEQNTTGSGCVPAYDFCFIDGPKHWTIDGMAFFLVDKLLKPGGWILFDDLTWKRSDQTHRQELDYISFLEMGEDEIASAHVDLVFKLLVMQHPNYGDFKIENNWWAWARKIKDVNHLTVADRARRWLRAPFGSLQVVQR
jgi:hypothetical protein